MRTPARHWPLKLSTLVVVTACFVVINATFLISQNFRNILTLWGEDVQMTVYLSPDLSSGSREFIEEKIKNSERVAEVRYIPRDQAFADFRVQMASYAPDITQDEELLKLIPSSLQVRLQERLSAEQQSQTLQTLASQIKAMEGVEEVSYGQDWIEKYAAVVSSVEAVLFLLGVVITAAALFVISNVVRASVQSRKEEIVVLEMIGATTSMVRRPFLVEGAVLGAGAAILSVIFSFVMYTGVKNLIVTKLSFFQLAEHIHFFSPSVIALSLLMGSFLGAVASYLCVRRMNDGFAGRQG
ncbi:MAG: ABC transporter permease [Bdellovibrio sp.]